MLIAALPKVVLSYTLAITTSVGSTAVNGFTSAETCSRIRDAAPTRIEAGSSTGVRVLQVRCWPVYAGEDLPFGGRPTPAGPDGGPSPAPVPGS